VLLRGLALAQGQGWLVQRGEDLSKADREVHRPFAEGGRRTALVDNLSTSHARRMNATANPEVADVPFVRNFPTTNGGW
jgi:hypothetical protein